MIEVKINVDDALNKTNKGIDAYDNRSRLYHQIAIFLNSLTEGAFKDQKDPTTGKQWHALSKRRVAQRGGSKRPILTWTRRLRSEILQDFKDDLAGVYSPTPYAEILNFGGTNQEGFTVPARPFIGMSESDGFEIESMAETHFFQPLK